MKKENVSDDQMLWKDRDNKKRKQQQKEELLYGNVPTLNDEEKEKEAEKMLTE